MSNLSHEIYESAQAIDRNEWEHLLNQSDAASFYHSIEWLAALERAKSWEPAHIVVYKKGNPVGLLPSFVTSIDRTPYARLVSVNPGYGNPLLTGDREEVLGRLLDAIEALPAAKVASHALRSDRLDHLALKEQLAESGYRLSVGGKFVLSLQNNWEDILEKMHRDRRSNIRRGLDSEASVEERSLEEDLDDFYRAYCSKMEELGSKPRPKPFFNELADRAADDLLLLTVFAEGERRGSHLYLLDNRQQRLRHYLVTITSDDFQYYSGELMHKYAIQWGLDNDWKHYDFGGNNSDFRTGGYQYKSQFGGELYPSFRWERELSTLFKMGRVLARRLR